MPSSLGMAVKLIAGLILVSLPFVVIVGVAISAIGWLPTIEVLVLTSSTMLVLWVGTLLLVNENWLP